MTESRCEFTSERIDVLCASIVGKQTDCSKGGPRRVNAANIKNEQRHLSEMKWSEQRLSSFPIVDSRFQETNFEEIDTWSAEKQR